MNEIGYVNLLQDLVFQQDDPKTEVNPSLKNWDIQRILLVEDQKMLLPPALSSSLLLCLRGKGHCKIKQELFTMHPGSLLKLPLKNAIALSAEVNSVFVQLSLKRKHHAT